MNTLQRPRSDSELLGLKNQINQMSEEISSFQGTLGGFNGAFSTIDVTRRPVIRRLLPQTTTWHTVSTFRVITGSAEESVRIVRVK